MAFSKVIATQDLWNGEMQGHRVGGRPVLLLKLDDRVYAYEDRCAHLGVPLSQGTLQDGVITCAAHHYSYDARTGRGVNPRNTALRALTTSVREAVIMVDVEGAE